MSLQDIWKHKTSAEKDKRVALTQKNSAVAEGTRFPSSGPMKLAQRILWLDICS